MGLGVLLGTIDAVNSKIWHILKVSMKNVRHGGLFSHDMDSGTSFLAPVLVGGISDAFDGGYKGLSYALSM